MQKLQILLLYPLLIVLFMVSCNNKPEPEHFTITLFKKVPVYPPATYIEYDSSAVYIDNVNDKDVITFPAYSKIVFSDTNVSVRYLGGWKDTLQPAPELTCFCVHFPEGVILDTVWEDFFYDVNYAILEVTRGNETFLDTAAFYDNWFTYINDDLSFNKDSNLFSYVNEDPAQYTEMVQKHLSTLIYIDGYYKLTDKLIFVDQFPYWKNHLDSTYLTFYAFPID